ncbi:MAG: hypothetical protein AAF552_01580 [Pseudomonadota bacterium]
MTEHCHVSVLYWQVTSGINPEKPLTSSHFPKRLHGRRTPPGLELTVLRKMPLLFLVTTLSVGSLSAVVRWFPSNDSLASAAKQIASVDIFVIATVVTLWTVLLTVSIGCVLVHIMKGPAYVADGYAPEEPAHKTSDPRSH